MPFCHDRIGSVRCLCGVILFEARDLAEAQAIAERNPFVTGGVFGTVVVDDLEKRGRSFLRARDPGVRRGSAYRMESTRSFRRTHYARIKVAPFKRAIRRDDRA